MSRVEADGQKHNVDLPGWGQYRAIAHSYVTGDLVVIALPLESLNTAIVRLTLLATGLGVVAVVAAALATRAVANAATKPLRSLSATLDNLAARPGPWRGQRPGCRPRPENAPRS